MRILLILSFTYLAFTFSYKSVSAAEKPFNDVDETEWELITNSSGIEVYERWVKVDGKTKVRERSGQMTLHCSKEEVIKLISDPVRTKLWMQNVEKVDVLKSVSETEWYQHTVLDAPWPFHKQDMVSKYYVVEDAKDNSTHIFINQELTMFPKQDGVDRLDSFSAEWEVKVISPNKVKVKFTTLSNRPPDYPCWIQDPVVRNIFFSNLKNFKKVLTKA